MGRESPTDMMRPSWKRAVVKVLFFLVIISMPGAFWAYMRKTLEWEQFLGITWKTAIVVIGMLFSMAVARRIRDLFAVRNEGVRRPPPEE